MSKHIFVIVWLTIMVIISKTINVYRREVVMGKEVYCVNRVFAFLTVLPLIWIAGTRQSFIDTGLYIQNFNNAPNTFEELPAYLDTMEKDIGFWMLGALIRILVSKDSLVYLSILAFIHGIILMSVYRRYSTSFFIAIFLFVASTDYLSWMHNGIRQFTAVVIIFAATPLMLKKKYLPLIMIVIVASLIHGSALFMLPIIFLVQGKPWNRKTMFAVCTVVIAIAFVGKFTDVLDMLLSDTQYTNVVTDWQTMEDDGTNLVRVFVYSIPTILSIIGFRYIKAADDPIINLACNMSIVSTALYCLSAVTSGIYVGRLPIYCSLYGSGILLPWEIRNIFKKRSAQLIEIIMVGAYLVFYYYQTHFVWRII